MMCRLVRWPLTREMTVYFAAADDVFSHMTSGVGSEIEFHQFLRIFLLTFVMVIINILCIYLQRFWENFLFNLKI